MKNFLYTCCALLGLISLTDCTKETVAEPDKEQTHENSALTATIEDISTKTNLDGVHVTWKEGDQIAIQLSSKHRNNAITTPNNKPYSNTFGVYNLVNEAANSKIGKFNFASGDEKITGNEEFFAFYPASFCKGNTDNGYFYFTFPQTQYYEDVMGDKFPLPMYGVGKDTKIEFNYAGAVIKLKVWASKQDTDTENTDGNGTVINSCEIVADGGFYNKAFTYIQKDGTWTTGLNSAGKVGHFTLKMSKPIPLSDNPENPTELKIVIPLAGDITLKNLKFSINCTKNGKHAGCELVKKSDLKIKRGTIVNFPTTEIKLDYTRMEIDGTFEGELDFDVLKKAKEYVKITMASGTKLSEETFKQIIEATRNLENVDYIESLGNSGNSNRQIMIDLSETETTADFTTIKGLTGNTYEGVCGGRTKDSGIKNISELRLPEGILTINNMAFSNSNYKKIVLPATLTKFSGMLGSGCDSLKWEVADGNKVFWTDDKGALYGNIEVTNEDKTKSTFKTLVALNGGSGETYRIQDGTEKIGSWCMYDNSVLTMLVLPDGIKKINPDGLSSTPSLTTIIVYGKPPVFNKNSGNNKVGNPNIKKSLYVEEKYYDQYIKQLNDPDNPNGTNLLERNNWQVLPLPKDMGIPEQNPAKTSGSN